MVYFCIIQAALIILALSQKRDTLVKPKIGTPEAVIVPNGR